MSEFMNQPVTFAHLFGFGVGTAAYLLIIKPLWVLAWSALIARRHER